MADKIKTWGVGLAADGAIWEQKRREATKGSCPDGCQNQSRQNMTWSPTLSWPVSRSLPIFNRLGKEHSVYDALTWPFVAKLAKIRSTRQPPCARLGVETFEDVYTRFCCPPIALLNTQTLNSSRASFTRGMFHNRRTRCWSFFFQVPKGAPGACCRASVTGCFEKLVYLRLLDKVIRPGSDKRSRKNVSLFG